MDNGGDRASVDAPIEAEVDVSADASGLELIEAGSLPKICGDVIRKATIQGAHSNEPLQTPGNQTQSEFQWRHSQRQRK